MIQESSDDNATNGGRKLTLRLHLSNEEDERDERDKRDDDTPISPLMQLLFIT